MALRLRNVPHQRRALAAAELHGAAGTRLRRPSHRRNHSRAEPRVYGSRLLRRAHLGMEPRAHHRAGHPVDARRHARPGGGARRKPVLPARGAAVAGRPSVERAPGAGRRPHDRNGRPLCTGIQSERHRPPIIEPLRPGAGVRAHRRRHFPRRLDARSAVLGPSRARLCRLSRPAERPLPLRIGRSPRRRRDRSAGA